MLRSEVESTSNILVGLLFFSQMLLKLQHPLLEVGVDLDVPLDDLLHSVHIVVYVILDLS